MSTRLLILLVLAALAFGLAGCKLSASTPPPTSPTVDSAMSTLEAELANIATQTAAAGGGATIPTSAPPAGGTPQPTAPVSTTASQPTAVPPTSKPVTAYTPTPGLPKTYQLQKGEFPFCIARRFNVNQNELLAMNGLNINSIVPVGYVLKIPQTGNHFYGTRALMKHPASYTVVSGDTVYTIACKFGDVDPNAIMQVNGLKSATNLKAGQVLQIP